jgi:hypothetical protein
MIYLSKNFLINSTVASPRKTAVLCEATPKEQALQSARMERWPPAGLPNPGLGIPPGYLQKTEGMFHGMYD